MWTSATFPRQKLHMGAWTPTIFAFWHIITRKDTAMQPLRHGSSTLPGHLGFLLMGGKIFCSQMPYRTVQRELKSVNGGCPALEATKLLQGIIQTKSLYSWRKRKCFCTASLNLSHLLASLPSLEELTVTCCDSSRRSSLSSLSCLPSEEIPSLWSAITPYSRCITCPHTHSGPEERLKWCTWICLLEGCKEWKGAKTLWL